MTSEQRWIKIENALQAIAENQAGHDARMAEFETRMNRIAEMTEKNEALAEKNMLAIDKNAGAIWNLLDRTHRIAELTDKNAAAIQDLIQNQKMTDERFNAILDRIDSRFDKLTQLLEKWFREGGRNGH